MSGYYQVKGDLVNKHFPLVFRLHKVFLQHLSKAKGLDSILIGNNQSIKKCCGRYHQLSGANYFGSEKVFRCRKINKSQISKSLIRFSGYIMK